jgi:hypothetical protein
MNRKLALFVGLTLAIFPAHSSAKTFNPEDINTELRKGVVNILCRSRSSFVNGISGSGVLVADSGVILTNAHIGQYFLLERYGLVNCHIRTGNPAKGNARANPLYISKQWLKENSRSLLKETATGSGENDFAFIQLATTTQIGKNLSPVTLAIDHGLRVRSQTIAVAYPAGMIGGFFIENALYASSAIPEITDILSFGTSTPDLFLLSGSILAQRGASGGLVSNLNGHVFGIISTVSEESNTKDRTMGAISIEHIANAVYKESGLSLHDLVSGNFTEVQARVKNYINETGREQATSLLETILRSSSGSL